MAKEYAENYTVQELLACFLSHDLEDGEEMSIGANIPILRAAVLLAHLTHAPNMKIRLSYTKTNLIHVPELPTIEFQCDYRGARWAECYFTDNEMVAWQKSRLNTRWFGGALQIDKYGNSNLIGIGNDYGRLKMRGPGGIGGPTVANNAKCFYLLVNSHDKRVFVDKCDYITIFGWGEGGADARKKLNFPGEGPRYVLTPLCIMDVDEETKRLRLKSVHPEVTVEQVVENTGFELIMPKVIPTTEPPTVEEIEILRNRIDLEKTLRK